ALGFSDGDDGLVGRGFFHCCFRITSNGLVTGTLGGRLDASLAPRHGGRGPRPGEEVTNSGSSTGAPHSPQCCAGGETGRPFGHRRDPSRLARTQAAE